MNFPGLFCLHLLFQNILRQGIPKLPCVERYFFCLWFYKMLSLDLRTVQHDFWLDYLCIYLQNVSPQRFLVPFDSIHLPPPPPNFFFPKSIVMEVLWQNWFCSSIGILSYKGTCKIKYFSSASTDELLGFSLSLSKQTNQPNPRTNPKSSY